MSLDITVFGGLAVRHDGIPLPLGGSRQQCLLAVLLLNRGRTVPRADLAEWSWPDLPPDTVDRQIANYISRLRRAVDPAGERIRLLARAPGFTAQVDAGLIDVERFTALLDQARQARAGYEYQVAAELTRTALGLWTGPPLDGLQTPYIRRRAEALERRRREAVLALAQTELDAGRPEEAVAALRDLVQHRDGHHDDEAVVTALVRALARSGQGAEAAHVAARAERSITAQGREPSPELRRAHSQALAGQRSPEPVKASGQRRQLPANTGAFTGREDELARIVGLAKHAQAESTPGVPAVCVIHGMGGVGKTALAVHAGHLLAQRFPGGQLFLELHTHSPGVAARTAFDALGAALSVLGAPPQAVPDDPDARAAKYRGLLAGTRTIVVLDDVADESQVWPLLPGDADCLVLVTSRNRLKALDEAEAVGLDVLPLADATALFRSTAGAGGRTLDAADLTDLVEICGRLPLALRITAALLRHRRSWSLADLLGDLRAGRDGLAAFDDGRRRLSAAFDLSYRALTDEGRLLLRRVGSTPGPDADAYAAAAATGLDLAPVRRVLHDLVDRSLLIEFAPGRFRMHDLLRDYCRARSHDEDTIAECEDAMDRLLDYYQFTADLADRRIRSTPAGRLPRVARPPRDHPRFEDYRTAENWLAAEIENLVAAVRHASSRSDPRHAAAIATLVGTHLHHHGPWTPSPRMYSDAAELAAGLDDRVSQARGLIELGRLEHSAGDYRSDEALEHYRSALQLNQETGQTDDEAFALEGIGMILIRDGRWAEGGSHLRQALKIFERLDVRPDAAWLRARLSTRGEPHADDRMPKDAGMIAEP